jgi:glycosyltransferase involved in cell wall biosynthesis
MPDTSDGSGNPRISVVTPTLGRPREVGDLLADLSQQVLLPAEVIIVDGAPSNQRATEEIVNSMVASLPFKCRYIRHGGGTAIQRNAGIDLATGDYIAFIDDDIRLEVGFFHEIMNVFRNDEESSVGGVAGYITNQHLDASSSLRWRWYKRLRLFTTYEPGHYDFETGYPINRYLQPPHSGLRRVDFMGAGCAVWRRRVFENNLRFSQFFTDYGVLEDAHFALKAGRKWTLLECGSARCVHLRSESSRADKRRIAHKSATNYRYVFVDTVAKRTWKHEYRFWRVQLFDLICFIAYAFRSRDRDSWLAVLGKLEGMVKACQIKPGLKKEY